MKKRNWKTTLFSAIAAAGTLPAIGQCSPELAPLINMIPPHVQAIMATTSPLALALFGMFAADRDETPTPKPAEPPQ